MSKAADGDGSRALTPAEKLAAKKTWRRPARNKTYVRKQTWNCAIRAIREALKISMHDVAKACVLSVTAYWQIEHGGDPMLSTARKLCEFFGKTEADLWPERIVDADPAANGSRNKRGHELRSRNGTGSGRRQRRSHV